MAFSPRIRSRFSPPAVTAQASGKVAFLKLFLCLYLPTAGVLGGVTYGILRLQADAQQARLQTQETARMEVAAHVLTHDFNAAASDLMVLARVPVLGRFLASHRHPDKQEVAQVFANTAREKPLYEQIRYLDAKGMEVVRIDRSRDGARIVPESELQDKAGRYYFQQSLRLAAGEVFVSPLDLNIEHDRIELPYKPMIRFGTPLVNRIGEKQGVVIVNVAAGRLLEDFRRAMGASDKAMLLNRHGYWLSSPDPAQEWGFMFGKDDTFAKHYPREWKAILAHDVGSVLHGEGLFVYRTVRPLSAGGYADTGSRFPEGTTERQAVGGDYYWKVVSAVPAASVSTLAFAQSPRLLGLYAGGHVVIAVLVGCLAAAIQARGRLSHAVTAGEDRYRTVLDTAIDGFIKMDKQGRLLDANPAYCRLVGYTREEILGLSLRDIEAAETPDEIAQHIERVIAAGSDLFETRHRCKDGSVVDVEISVNYHAGKGRFFSFVRDLTGRKKAERERLLEADRQRDALVRQVHHRIKNNLQGSIGLLHLYVAEHPEVAPAVGNVIGKIMSVAVVFGLQGRRDEHDIRLCEVVREVCKATATQGGVNIKPIVRIDVGCPVRITRDAAVAVALIVNELVANALQHRSGQNDGEPIEVSFTPDGDAAMVKIRNKCLALPPGFDFDRGTGLGAGLSLVRAMLPRQGAALTFTLDHGAMTAELRLAPPVITFATNPLDACHAENSGCR